MTVTLRELEALCAVVEEGSFRAAARALGYTPSAVSHQLAGLERSLGVKLFLRPGGRARASLTPAGEVAYAQARRVLAGLTALGAEVAGVVDGRRASLSVGVIQTAAVELLPGSLRALRQTGTSTEVRLVEVHASGDVAQALRQGSLDVAFAVNPALDAGIEVLPLVEDPWVVVAPKGHGVLQAGTVGLEALDGVDVVAWHRRWARQAELEDAFDRSGVRPEIVFRTDDNLALQRLVAAGLGVACIGLLSVRHLVEPELGWVPLRPVVAPPRVALCLPSDRPMGPATQAFVAAVEAEARFLRATLAGLGAPWSGGNVGGGRSVSP